MNRVYYVNCKKPKRSNDTIALATVFVDALWLQGRKFHILLKRVIKVYLNQVFLRCFRDPIPVPNIENRVPRISEIGSLPVHIGYLTFSLKKTA